MSENEVNRMSEYVSEATARMNIAIDHTIAIVRAHRIDELIEEAEWIVQQLSVYLDRAASVDDCLRIQSRVLTTWQRFAALEEKALKKAESL